MPVVCECVGPKFEHGYPTAWQLQFGWDPAHCNALNSALAIKTNECLLFTCVHSLCLIALELTPNMQQFHMAPLERKQSYITIHVCAHSARCSPRTYVLHGSRHTHTLTREFFLITFPQFN